MEIRFNIDKKFIKDLERDLNLKDEMDVVRNALGVLKWTVDRMVENRVIIAIAKGENGKQLVAPWTSKKELDVEDILREMSDNDVQAERISTKGEKH